MLDDPIANPCCTSAGIGKSSGCSTARVPGSLDFAITDFLEPRALGGEEGCFCRER